MHKVGKGHGVQNRFHLIRKKAQRLTLFFNLITDHNPLQSSMPELADLKQEFC